MPIKIKIYGRKPEKKKEKKYKVSKSVKAALAKTLTKAEKHDLAPAEVEVYGKEKKEKKYRIDANISKVVKKAASKKIKTKFVQKGDTKVDVKKLTKATGGGAKLFKAKPLPEGVTLSSLYAKKKVKDAAKKKKKKK